MYERDRFEGFNLRGTVHLTSAFSTFFDARYIDNRRDKLDMEAGFDYSAQCWRQQGISGNQGGKRRPSLGHKLLLSFLY
ncbi:MAG: DUF481 domain-containing protein [Desulfomicrobium escambiense]|nr:DUF481 domain-containing protein [Desulfomicrobium escambiense]